MRQNIGIGVVLLCLDPLCSAYLPSAPSDMWLGTEWTIPRKNRSDVFLGTPDLTENYRTILHFPLILKPKTGDYTYDVTLMDRDKWVFQNGIRCNPEKVVKQFDSHTLGASVSKAIWCFFQNPDVKSDYVWS